MKNTLPFGLNEIFPNLAWAGALAVAAIAFLGAQPAHAAGNGTWNVNADGSWVTAGDPPWLSSVVPGATSGTTSTDTATFGFTLNATRTVTVDANRNIGGITFSNTSAFGYTLSGGNLLLSNGGVIQMLSSAGSHSENINSPITIEGDGGAASFIDNAPSSGRFIVNGTIKGVSTPGNTTTLTLDGTNTVAGETITGIISDGAGGGKLAVVKNGAGQWRLNGHNSFSGGVTLNAGILGFKVYDAFGTGTLTVNGGELGAVNTTVSATVANKIVVGGNFSTTQGGASGTVANNLTFSGSMDLGGATRTITTGAMGTYTGGTNILAFSGVISNGGLIKDGAGALTLSGNNTYTGDTTVTLGTLVLAAGSQTSFDIGAIGTNNKILGTAGGSEGINLNGNFVFNLTGAGTGLGNNWNIVDMMNFTPTYGGTFGVVGFTDNLDNTWSKLNGGITYTFSEGTGSLSVTAIPEPSTLAFLAISLSVVVCARLLRCRGRSGIRE